MLHISEEEITELSRLNYILGRWVAYCNDCRDKTKENKKVKLPPVEIDYKKDLTNEQYYRISELSRKFYGDNSPYAQPYLSKLEEI